MSSLDELTAVWSSLLLETPLSPLEAVQSFSSSLLSLIHHLDSSPALPPPSSPLPSPASTSCTPSSRTSVLSHLHAHTSRVLRSVRSQPPLRTRVLHLHILLTIAFPSPPHDPPLAPLFRLLDSASPAPGRLDGFDFLRRVVGPNFGPAHRAALTRVCSQNFYPVPLELLERFPLPPSSPSPSHADADDDAWEDSPLPLGRRASVASSTSGTSRERLRRSLSVASVATVVGVGARAPPAFAEAMPAQARLAALRQQRAVAMDRAREEEERLRREVRGVDGRTGRSRGLKRQLSVAEAGDAERPPVTLTRFSTGVRIHTHIERKPSVALARQNSKEAAEAASVEAEGEGGGEGREKGRRARKGARQLVFGDDCGRAGATQSLASLQSRHSSASSPSLPTPLTTPSLSASSRSSPQSVTPPLSASPLLSPQTGCATRRSHRGSHLVTFVAETPQTRQAKRGRRGEGSATSSASLRSARSGRSARNVSSPSRRSLDAALEEVMARV